jgi:translation initiation factor 2 beta subunit (eIF-2beta)/eIF-5
MGALTQGSLPIGKETETVFRIPNLVVRKEFLQTLADTIAQSKNNSDAEEEQLAVTALMMKMDIEPLCTFLMKSFSSLKGNAVIHQKEINSQDVVKTIFQRYGKTIDRVEEFKCVDDDEIERDADLVYRGTNNTIHIELKVILPYYLQLRNQNGEADNFDGQIARS